MKLSNGRWTILVGGQQRKAQGHSGAERLELVEHSTHVRVERCWIGGADLGRCPPAHAGVLPLVGVQRLVAVVGEDEPETDVGMHIGAVGPGSVAVTSALGLDEPFTVVQAVGGTLVIFGVLLVSLRKDVNLKGRSS
jgi:hypothetical protein